MNECLSLFIHTFMNAQGGSFIETEYLLLECMHMFNDNSISFIKFIDPTIVLPHIY